jgi:hypothetical protein
MCQNDPGLCDEWDATAGGNRAFTFGADAVHLAASPGDGMALLEKSCAVRFEEGHDHRTSMNFGGGGYGYGLRCRPCGTAAFLWQR